MMFLDTVKNIPTYTKNFDGPYGISISDVNINYTVEKL